MKIIFEFNITAVVQSNEEYHFQNIRIQRMQIWKNIQTRVPAVKLLEPRYFNIWIVMENIEIVDTVLRVLKNTQINYVHLNKTYNNFSPSCKVWVPKEKSYFVIE